MSDRIVAFCVQCFADEDSGSWSHAVIPEADFCANCCASGTLVRIPARAVGSIRQQASWVGKRYYPNDEDRQRYEERADLLETISVFPGRSARLEEDRWVVTQLLPDGRHVSTFVRKQDAADAMEAMRASKLRFVPAHKLPGTGAAEGGA